MGCGDKERDTGKGPEMVASYIRMFLFSMFLGRGIRALMKGLCVAHLPHLLLAT